MVFKIFLLQSYQTTFFLCVEKHQVTVSSDLELLMAALNKILLHFFPTSLHFRKRKKTVCEQRHTIGPNAICALVSMTVVHCAVGCNRKKQPRRNTPIIGGKAHRAAQYSRWHRSWSTTNQKKFNNGPQQRQLPRVAAKRQRASQPRGSACAQSQPRPRWLSKSVLPKKNPSKSNLNFEVVSYASRSNGHHAICCAVVYHVEACLNFCAHCLSAKSRFQIFEMCQTPPNTALASANAWRGQASA